MMAGTGHKSITPGQRALVHLKNGQTFIDRFLEDRDHTIVFEQRGRVAAALVRSVCRYKMVEASNRDGEQLRRTCRLCDNTYQAREAVKMVAINGHHVCRGCLRTLLEVTA